MFVSVELNQRRDDNISFDCDDTVTTGKID